MNYREGKAIKEKNIFHLISTYFNKFEIKTLLISVDIDWDIVEYVLIDILYFIPPDFNQYNYDLDLQPPLIHYCDELLTLEEVDSTYIKYPTYFEDMINYKVMSSKLSKHLFKGFEDIFLDLYYEYITFKKEPKSIRWGYFCSGREEPLYKSKRYE